MEKYKQESSQQGKEKLLELDVFYRDASDRACEVQVGKVVLVFARAEGGEVQLLSRRPAYGYTTSDANLFLNEAAFSAARAAAEAAMNMSSDERAQRANIASPEEGAVGFARVRAALQSSPSIRRLH